MRRLAKTARLLVPLTLLVLTGRPALAVSDTYDWYEGADGYLEALEIAEKEERPLIIYFHVDWCGYCRRFSNEYLDDYDIDNFISDYLRVKINPEDGDGERKIAKEYGVKGYPTFLVTFPAESKATRVHPFKKGGNDQSPEAFLGVMRGKLESAGQ